jgi:hypothetical protein
MQGQFKSLLAGAIGAALVVGGSAAFAGSGVGGIFNLGEPNTVDGSTGLSGNTPGNQLYVANASPTNGAMRADAVGGIGVYGRSQTGRGVYGYHSGAGTMPGIQGDTSGNGAGVLGRSTGGGPGLRAIVNSGVAPLAVNSSTKVASLNADRLDGFEANGLARAARMTTQGFLTLTELSQPYGPQVTITAPQAGLVLANAAVTVRNPSNCTNGCIAVGQIRHVETGGGSTPSKTTVLKDPEVPLEATMANLGMSYVFEVSPGVNTFEVRLNREAGDGSVLGWYGEMNALYVPFGGTGGSTLSAAANRRR